MGKRFEEKLTELQNGGLLTFEKNKPLSLCSSFRIGGPAAYAVYPRTPYALTEVYRAVRQAGIEPRIMGNASNVLFPDEGYDGVILFTTSLCGVRVGSAEMEAGAGESVTGLALKAQKAGLSGLEFLYGIPGSVGGAVYMNAGAYEHSTSEVLSSSVCWFPETGERKTLSSEEHRFDYRHSVYMENGAIILSALYRLHRDDPAAIRARMDDYMERRRSKQPLEYSSAGSVFKRYPGRYTGQMIEQAGLKGVTVGGAQVSTKHAGFIVNVGGATARDVKELVALIEEKIFETFGVRIERELIYFE